MTTKIHCDHCDGVITAESFPRVVKKDTSTTDYCSFKCLTEWATRFGDDRPKDLAPEPDPAVLVPESGAAVTSGGSFVDG